MKLGALIGIVCGFVLCFTVVPGADAGPSNWMTPTVTVNAVRIPGFTPLTLKTSELAVLPQVTDTVEIGNQAMTERGPLLSSLLTFAGVQYNSSCSNADLRYWVEVTSSDGDAALITAGELDSGFGDRPAILSIDQNGSFLTTSGPRLIVPGDATDIRDIQHVSTITVGEAPLELASTGSPACGTSSLMPVPASGTVIINGDVAKPMTLTVAQLQAMPQVSQTDTYLSGSASKTATESGPTLYSLVEAAQPKFLACDATDKTRFYVEVTSSEDGFAALVSWTEFDPSLDNDQSLMSVLNNGAPVLTTDTDPRLTMPGDVHGGRYVFGAAVITVFRAPTETRIPSCQSSKTAKS